MAFNLKMSLLCAVCILISGLLGSFKSFQLYNEHREQVTAEEGHQVSQWVAQSIEQKLQQLEASVSYLDKSTVETLKRFGTRYFAYAYKKKGEWSVKWKILGPMGKEAIMQEVGELSFDKLSSEKRSWLRSKSHELIYVAPVELADSHQLKSGFLVFGIDKKFFSYLSSRDTGISLISDLKENVHGHVTSALFDNEVLFNKELMGHSLTSLKGEQSIVTSYFSPLAQLWVFKAAPLSAISFFASSFFTYFLLASAISLMAFSFFVSLFLKNFKPSTLFSRPVRFPVKEILNNKGAGIESEIDEESREEELVISDLGDWLNSILAEQTDRLRKVEVSLKTQFEDGAQVRTTPSKLKDLLERLIGNSVLSLENEETKEIQIQLAEQSDSFQLIYVDSRSENFPSGEEPSVFLQTDGSMEGIDGIISYAAWQFGKSLTVAKKGFCLSVDLPKVDVKEVEAEPLVVASALTGLDRIEIKEEDTDVDMFGELDLNTKGETSKTEDLDSEEVNASFDDVVEQFRMKAFEFDAKAQLEARGEEIPKIELEEDLEEDVDDSGMIQLDSGQFKLKIRSPKKRDVDVDR